MNRSQSVFALCLCLLLVGVSLASCGGESTTTDNMTLRVGQVTTAIPFFPLYIAEQKNFFKDQGLTLNPSPPPSLNSGPKVAQAVEANSLDVGVGSITDVFTLSRVNAHIKIVGDLSNSFVLDIVVSKNLEQQANVTPASPLADKVKALVGKKIGITAPNSATEALITYLFKQQHLDLAKDAVAVPIGANTSTELADLKAGTVDAIVVTIPGGQMAAAQGYGETLISPANGDVSITSDGPDNKLLNMQTQAFGVAYAKDSVIQAKPKAMQAFIRGLAQAETFIQQKPTEAIALMKKYQPNLSPDILNAAWTALKASMPTTPLVSQDAYECADSLHKQAGLIALDLSYTDLVATDTINSALNGFSSSS